MRKIGIILLLFIHSCSIGSIMLDEVDDRAITSTIVTLLIQDLQINQLNIKVITDEGEVIIIGRVETFKQREQTEMHARSVSKVWSVVNLLKTGQVEQDQNSTEFDFAIQRELKTQFIQKGYLSLTILSFEGEVFLIGRVSSKTERANLLELSENTLHVKKVHNFIKAGSRF